MTHPRAHHELASATPQAIAILATGATIYGGRLVAWVVRTTKKGGRK